MAATIRAVLSRPVTEKEMRSKMVEITNPEFRITL